MFKKYLFLILFLFLPITVFGAMSSTNFLIFADSINVGGFYSSSSNFTLSDTVGEMATGFSTSSLNTYEIRAGFQFMDLESGSFLSLLVTGDSLLDLGVLSTTTISSATTSVNISTDSLTGCSLKISNVSGTGFDSLDGDVTIGEEEIGISVNSGSDLPLQNNQTLFSIVAPTLSQDVDLELKASIDEFSIFGTYAKTITLLVIANP
jgi:hypothetical protein